MVKCEGKGAGQGKQRYNQLLSTYLIMTGDYCGGGEGQHGQRIWTDEPLTISNVCLGVGELAHRNE